MKALVKKQPGKGIWMEDVPVPEVGINDVLIKIKKTAICGTDLHIYKWDEWSQNTIKTPMTIGHEYVGTVVDLCIPESNVVKLEDGISDDLAAIMDPFGNATHTACSFPVLGEDVLITGAGLIGTMATGICKFAGARHVVVTDLNDYRLDIAKRMGATVTVNASKGETVQQAMDKLGIKGFDVGLEMSGSPVAFRDMISHMYKGSNIAQLGILPPTTTVNWDDIIFNAITIKGIYGREMWETWYKMKQMILSGLDLTPVITHHFDVDDFQKGFDVMESGLCGKVILNWEK